MDKEERDWIESINVARGFINAFIISCLFWGTGLTVAAALIGALT